MSPSARLLALATAAALLTACGSADDASTEATADTVEMPADEALAPITEEPVADPEANTPDAAEEADPAAATAEAADAAANVAAEAAAAAAAGADEAPQP